METSELRRLIKEGWTPVFERPSLSSRVIFSRSFDLFLPPAHKHVGEIRLLLSKSKNPGNGDGNKAVFSLFGFDYAGPESKPILREVIEELKKIILDSGSSGSNHRSTAAVASDTLYAIMENTGILCSEIKRTFEELAQKVKMKHPNLGKVLSELACNGKEEN